MENNPSKNYTVNLVDKSSSDFPHGTSSFKEGHAEEINESHRHYQKGTGSKSPVVIKKGSKNFMAPTISAASKISVPRKKILAERNEVLESFSETQINLEPGSEGLSSDSKQREGCKFSTLSPCSSRASDLGDRFCISPDASLPYDPLTNYLSPRPQFLRYKPNRRLEMVLQRDAESKKRENEEEGFDLDGKFSLETESRLIRKQENSVKDEILFNASYLNEESEIHEVGPNIFAGKSEPSIDIDEEDEEDEEEEDRPRCPNLVFRSMFVLMALIIGFLSVSARYPSDVEPSPGHSYKQDLLSIKDLSGDQDVKRIGPHSQIAVNYRVWLDRFPQTNWDLFNASQTFFPHPTQDEDNLGEGVSSLPGLTETNEENNSDSSLPGLTETNEENNGDRFIFYPNHDLISEEKQLQNSTGSMMLEDEEGDNFSDQELVVAITKDRLVETEMEKTEDFKDWTGGFPEQIEKELQGRENIICVSNDAATDENSETLKLLPSSSESRVISDHGEEPDHHGDFATRETSWIKSMIRRIILKGESVTKTAIIFTISALVAASLTMGCLYLKNKKTSPTDSAISEVPLSDSRISKKSSSLTNPDDSISQKSDSHFEPSSLLEFEYSNLYRTCPPKAQFLGEYAPGEIGSSDKKSSIRLEMEGRDNISSSQERSSRRICLSSATINHENQTFPEFSAAESPSYGSFTAQEKLQRKKESFFSCVQMKKQERGDEEEGKKKKDLITPVRRSSRIRNRALSP